MRFLTVAFFSLALFFVASSARAQESPAAPVATSEASSADVRLVTGLGIFGASEGGGLAINGALLGRKGYFEGGFLGEAAGGIGLSYASLGAVAGLGLAPDAKWRIDLLAQGGVDVYSGFGNTFLGGDPGADGASPFVGARLGFSHRWRVFELGALTAVATDVARPRVTYSYTDSSWIDASSTWTETRTRDVGTTRYTVMLTLGAGWDL